MGLDIHTPEDEFGACPVQVWGKIDEHSFYFRSRGKKWSLQIADTLYSDPMGKNAWSYREVYSEEEFAAGWITPQEAVAFINKATQIWRGRTSTT